MNTTNADIRWIRLAKPAPANETIQPDGITLSVAERMELGVILEERGRTRGYPMTAGEYFAEAARVMFAHDRERMDSVAKLRYADGLAAIKTDADGNVTEAPDFFASAALA